MSAQAKIAEPWETVDGATIGKWAQGWLKWVANANAETPVATPFGAVPLSDGQVHQASAAFGELGQSGPVFFLAGGDWGVPNPTPANHSLGPVINVPQGKDIFLPMVNGIDVETGDPKVSTIPEWPETKLPYSAEAKFVANLFNASIYEAHLTVAKTSDPTHPFLKLEWPNSSLYFADSGVFDLGQLHPDGYLASLLGNTQVSFADVAGRWAMIEGLPKGDYVMNFGGSGHVVHDPLDPKHGIILSGPDGGDWSHNTTDILHVA